MKRLHKMLTITSIISISLIFIRCSSSTNKSGSVLNEPSNVNLKYVQEVSIISLISNPEKYNGSRVRIIGYLNMEYENDAIYLHKEDYDLKINKNSIGIEILRRQRDSLNSKGYNNKYVFVEGTFNMHRANEGSFNSSVVKITRLGLHSDNVSKL
jgi:hypothetical protein